MNLHLVNLQIAGATAFWIIASYSSNLFLLLYVLMLKTLVSKEQSLCVEDPQLSHEVEIDEGQADQQVLHQVEDGCDEAKEGNEANTHKEEG